MSFKKTIKHILGKIRCLRNGISHQWGVYIGSRVHITRGNNIKLGKGTSIRPDCDLFAGDFFEIGERCDIGTRNRIAGNVIIGSDVLFGPDNYISSTDHVFEDPEIPIMSQGAKAIRKNGHSELKIGDGSWIGTHCAIIGDVHIGKHCVIGANSVVTRDVPDCCVVVGCPAKVVKRYNFQTCKWENMN